MNFYSVQIIQVNCGLGLVEYVKDELRALGYDIETQHNTGVELRGTLYDAMLLNLHLRTAQYVMVLLKEFECKNPDQLYKNINSMAWEEIIPDESYISIISRADHPTIKNTMFASMKVKDAIADRMVKKTGSRPDSGKDRHRLVFNLHWKGDRAWLYLNTTGMKLSDRGYRKMPHAAPMRESLAAAVIMQTGYDSSKALINPMCGSGTLAIEAALIASGRAPGATRGNFSFMHIRDFDAGRWKQLRTQARKNAQKHGKTHDFKKIIASDIDPQAVEAARKNSVTAGVDHMIDFQVCDFEETALNPEGGIIIMNPEYGERLGREKELKDLYKRIGDFLKQKCAGYSGYIFTGNLKLAKSVGLQTSQRSIFFNADIECRLLKYEIYEGSRKNR